MVPGRGSFFCGGQSTGAVLDVARIKEAVDRFRFFFELQDADRLKTESWTSMSPKAYGPLKNTCQVLSHVTVQKSCLSSPVIVSDFAEWTCSEVLGYEVDGRPRCPQTHVLQFHLKRWMVSGMWRSGRCRGSEELLGSGIGRAILLPMLGTHTPRNQ